MPIRWILRLFGKKRHKMRRNKGKGFTLIELLAVIAITGLVFGVTGTFVYKIITNSKNRSIVLAENNIKKTASVYTEEYSNDVAWIQNMDNEETSYTCIAVNSLVNKGYLKESDIQKEYLDKYVSLTKDKNGTIIDMYFSNDKKCDANGKPKVSIPTASEYCSYPEYSLKKQRIISTKVPNGFTFIGSVIAQDAGNYEIEAKLNDGYIWNDNSEGVKKITCSIRKTSPTVVLSSYGEIGKNLDHTSISLTSNVGGSITLKTSNSNVASASISSKKISANSPGIITVKKYATKNNNTYITINFIPDDTKNYNTTNVIYTIGNVKKKVVNKPSCINPYYDGTTQELVRGDAGYVLINNEAQEIGYDYKVTARLKYGYVWNDDKKEDYELTCAIKRPTPKVTYDNNGGVGCSSTTVNYGAYYGNLCVPTKTGHDFLGWYTSPNGGNKIENNTTVTNFRNHTIYAHWQAKTYVLDVNPVINGTIYYSGVNGFSFKVYLNGNLVADNVIDYGNNRVPYGTQVRVVPNGVTGYDASEASVIINDTTSLSGPTWNVKSYILDVNPVINGGIYYSGASGFSFKVYLNGNLDTSHGNDVLDYYQYVPYGTQVRVVPNGVWDYAASEATTTMGASDNSLTGPTWTGNWHSFTATFNYVVDANHNFSLIGNNATSTSTCSYQVPASTCNVATPGLTFGKSTTSGNMIDLFNVTWGGIAYLNNALTLNSDVTLTLSVSSKYANNGTVLKGGKDNAWVRKGAAVNGSLSNSQKYGYIRDGYSTYWADGDYRIGQVNHLVWIKGHGYGVRCKKIGEASAELCDAKSCDSKRCRVPSGDGNGWISLRALKW